MMAEPSTGEMSNTQTDDTQQTDERSVPPTRPAEQHPPAPPSQQEQGNDDEGQQQRTQDQPQQQQQQDEPVPDDAICRYCFDGGDDGELISPCNCRGGQKYVHLSCLRRWQRRVLVSQPTHPAFYRDDVRHHKCNVCMGMLMLLFTLTFAS